MLTIKYFHPFFVVTFWPLENTPNNRESKAEYESRLIATDRDGQAVETKVVIKLRDENDNAPKFTQPPKEVDFDEAKPAGSLIAR